MTQFLYFMDYWPRYQEIETMHTYKIYASIIVCMSYSALDNLHIISDI